MGSYLVSNIEYPATQYEPAAPEVNGVYHEDREVNLSGVAGDSQMYRTYNAQFNTALGIWAVVTPGVSDAYATVQGSDGSIHYYKLNSSGTWDGSGNNAVYNTADFAVSAANSDNGPALSDAINAAIAAGGGLITIPPGVYKLESTIDIAYMGVPGEDFGIIIAGVSGTTELLMKKNYVANDVFSFYGFNSGRGVRLKDLRITYDVPDTPPDSLAAAVRAQHCQNLTCERVYFNNCPQAFTDDTSSLECGLFDCTITYNSFSANESTGVVPAMVYFNGTENYIDSCIISQQPRDDTTDPGPTGCIGVIVQPAGVFYITNTHISHFTQGIMVLGGPNPDALYCSNVLCESWSNSLVVKPTSAPGEAKIYQVYCDDCFFAMTEGSTDPSATGVLIDTNGGMNSNVSEIFLNNCMVANWAGPGVQINAGQNIVITGGRYGSNATNEPMSGAIAITGTASNITISGADLTPTVPSYGGVQPFAISISAAVEGLYVRGCNMTGYSPGPVSVTSTSPVTAAEITDCAGYNDQGTVVSTTAPPSTTPFNGTYAGFSTPYFGPVTFYARSGTGTIMHIKLNGHDTNLTSGTFSISPGTWKAEIDYSAAINFLMIGE
jgi:hypothetical protein